MTRDIEQNDKYNEKELEKLLMIAMVKSLYKAEFINFDICEKVISDIERL